MGEPWGRTTRSVDGKAGKSSPDAVRLEQVSKRYGRVVALSDFSLTLRSGTITALVGPNGAGKTTLLETMVGLRRPDRGTVALFGTQLHAVGTRLGDLLQDVGIQLQNAEFFRTATLRDCFRLFSTCYRRPIDIEALVARFGLAGQMSKKLGQLSGGWRQRAFLALALINDPALILLDEPTTGLDPEARRDLWTIIAELGKSGRTVLLSTHAMEEAERLASRVLVINGGCLIADASPAELIATHAGKGGTLEDVYLNLLSQHGKRR